MNPPEKARVALRIAQNDPALTEKEKQEIRAFRERIAAHDTNRLANCP